MILVINTSSAGVELLLDSKHVFIETSTQSLALPVEAEKFLAENNAKWSDLTAVGVVVGPGSFTGIRLGIAYAKGIAIGRQIPVIPINAFELYLYDAPDAFVAIDSGRSDLFVAAHDLLPGTMEIEQIETKQMEYPRTVGHRPFNLANALPIIKKKIESGADIPVVPMYLRPSYAELNAK